MEWKLLPGSLCTQVKYNQSIKDKLNGSKPSVETNLNSIHSIGPFHANVNQKICRLEIVFDRLWYPLSILLLAAIGAKLIGPHGGLQVGKKGVTDVTGSMEWPL